MSDPDQEKKALENDKITERFWSLTNRREREAELGPQDFDKWGKIFKIKELSITLRSLIEGGVTETMDHLSLLHKILEELDIGYKILPMKSSDKTKKMVVYDIASIPRWSFCGMAPTEEEASAQAAKKGIDFLVFLAK